MGATLYPDPDRSADMAKANNAFSDTEFKVPNFSQFYADYSRMMGDFGKLFGNSKTSFLDINAVVATQQRNIEALTKANKLAFDGAQAAARRQVEIVRQGFDDLAKMSHELAAAGSPEDKLARQADFAKESFATAVGAIRELSELLQKSNLEAADVISKRMSDNFDEVKTALSQVNGSH
jgi:phasin family protein